MADSDDDTLMISMRAYRDELADQLQRATVCFGEVNEREQTMRIAGSGVVASLFGLRVILTAGHVLDSRAFGEGRMGLSVNRRGRFVVPSHSERLISPGGVHGPDAGVLLLPEIDAGSYFEFGNFETVRASTLKTIPPNPPGLCLVSGYLAAMASTSTRELHADIETVLIPGFAMVIAHVVDVDPVHYWLGINSTSVNLQTGQQVPFAAVDRDGDSWFNGMSGCGSWTMRLDGDEAKLSLNGVHTGNDDGQRLRETSIVHHLRLIAGHSETLRAKAQTAWPDIELG